MEILGADFLDWLCDGSDVNEAFKMDEVADLNLPSDLPTTSGQHTGNICSTKDRRRSTKNNCRWCFSKNSS